ncbi:hypothetical protein NKI20_19635 [Mesorhizobium sp. M0830]|uniref:hypothetical protein n=1 Tax=Mesorhizobium sp. M0830 TaxID=2957008 RepID=UPI00333A3AFA
MLQTQRIERGERVIKGCVYFFAAGRDVLSLLFGCVLNKRRQQQLWLEPASIRFQ